MSALVLCALSVLALACASEPLPEPNAPGPAEPPRIRLEVTNYGSTLVQVHALVDGLHLCLGDVDGMGSAVFPLPAMASRAFELRVAASALGSEEEFVSEPVKAAAGQSIDFAVFDVIRRSTVTVRDLPPVR